MTTKFTPGPWLAQCASFRGWQVHKEGDFLKPLATVYARNEDYGNDGGPYYDEESRANARLIAAAPDLLAALEDFVTSGVEFDDDRIGYITVQVNRITLRDAQAAIAKAEGTTPTNQGEPG